MHDFFDSVNVGALSVRRPGDSIFIYDIIVAAPSPTVMRVVDHEDSGTHFRPKLVELLGLSFRLRPVLCATAKRKTFSMKRLSETVFIWRLPPSTTSAMLRL